MSGEYQRAIREAVPDAEICFDRGMSAGSPAAPPTRSAATNGTHDAHHRDRPLVKGTRWSLLKAPASQTIYQLATLAEVQRENRRLYRAFLLREELRRSTTSTIPASPRAPRRLAGVGDTLFGCRPSCASHALPASTRGHPRRCPPRPVQRPARGPQLQDPPDQPPQLQLPHRRRADRPRLLCCTHRYRPAPMNFTRNGQERHICRRRGATRASRHLDKAARASSQRTSGRLEAPQAATVSVAALSTPRVLTPYGKHNASMPLC